VAASYHDGVLVVTLAKKDDGGKSPIRVVIR
jgi:HSP20 family molecular chaperone IbpA